MKRSNQLILLALLVCGALWAQPLTTITVGTNPNGPVFFVDGTPYITQQVFEWPLGSKHIVQFPFSVDANGVALPYQNADSDNIRYSFGGWTENTGLLGTASDPIQTISADSGLTSIIALVQVSYQIVMDFNTGATSPVCGAPGNPPAKGSAPGIVYFDTTCFANSGAFFTPAGVHNLNAFPYPGWVFYGFLIGNSPPNYLQTVNVTTPLRIIPQFSIAKRVDFITSPPGLTVLVDGGTIQTPQSGSPALTGSCPPDYTRLPPNAPAGFTPLCWGQFDMLPGSKHHIGAAVPQYDKAGNLWVFSAFSDGLGQNAVYTADFDTPTPDIITAIFVPGVHVAILTNPAGVRLTIDGRDTWPGNTFIWGQGEVHTISAPAQSTNTAGRLLQFVAWSNKGANTQTITIPAVRDFAVTAAYQMLSRIVVHSSPDGLPATVDGTPCTTPCTVDRLPGSTAQLVIPGSTPTAPGSREDFVSWDNGTSALTRTLTFNQDLLTITASYRASYLLTTSSNPAGDVSFKVSMPSSDSYYANGSQVTVTAVPKTGFQFRRWGGDLSGTSATGTLTMSSPHSVVALLNKIPYVAPSGVQNAAGPTPDGTVAPGSIIAIYGDQLSTSLQIGPGNPLQQALANVTVTVNNQLLPLFFVSEKQINAQLPSNLPAGEYTLLVHQVGLADTPGSFTVSRDAPGLFTQANTQNLPLALALHQDGTLITFASPARRNETVTLYGTGFGPYSETVLDGFAPLSTTLISVSDPVSLTLGAQQFPPDSTSAAPQMVGMTIVKLTITDAMPTGVNADVVVAVNGKNSTKVVLPLQ